MATEDATATQDVRFAFIDSLPGYRFDDTGNTWSRWVRGSKRHRMREEWRIILARRNPEKDYLYVILKTPGGRKTFRVNILILWAFTGYRPEGMEASHINGNRVDNRLVNLEWKSHYDNILDKFKHGTIRMGERIPSAKLKAEDVLRIKKLIASGRSYESLGREFGVSGSAISYIARGRTWTHLDEDQIRS
jgi:hypothetical protein